MTKTESLKTQRRWMRISLALSGQFGTKTFHGIGKGTGPLFGHFGQLRTLALSKEQIRDDEAEESALL